MYVRGWRQKDDLGQCIVACVIIGKCSEADHVVPRAFHIQAVCESRLRVGVWT